MSTVGPKTKRFGRPAALNNASEIINPLRDVATPAHLIPLDKVDMDPDNIRPILLNTDRPEEIDEASPLAARMREQLEGIRGLARSIETHGLINAVEVYRRADRYVLATGQRRFLAHRLLELPMIRASVLMARPKNLRAQQYIENEQRNDMSLAERVDGIDVVLEEAKLTDATFQDQWQYLSGPLGLSKTTSYRYLTLSKAPVDLREAIQSGLVSSVKTAMALVAIEDDVERASALSRLENGEDIESAGEGATDSTEPGKDEAGNGNAERVKRSVGRPTTKITLGSIEQPNVVRGIIRDLLGNEFVPDIDWSDLKAVSKAFQACLPEIAKRYA